MTLLTLSYWLALFWYVYVSARLLAIGLRDPSVPLLATWLIAWLWPLWLLLIGIDRTAYLVLEVAQRAWTKLRAIGRGSTRR